MTSAFGLHGRFIAQPGRADELADLLLEAAEGLDGNDACLLYAISRNPEQPDEVIVTEAWTDAAAHQASLQDPATRELIAQARPLIADIPGHERFEVLGGKGLNRPPGLA